MSTNDILTPSEQAEQGVPLEGDLQALIATDPRLRRPAKTRERPVVKPRLTVIQTVYHQEPGGDPTSYESRFARFLDSKDQQPCVRRLAIGESWQTLDELWLERVSQLVIANRELPPKEDESGFVRKLSRCIEVAFNGVPCLLIRPTESQRYEPLKTLSTISLRSTEGIVKIVVAAFPT